jgi:tyrosyl-tRNA synthetase
MFKKVMEIPDHLILRYFELVTDEHPDRITEIKNQLENGKNPRDCKLELAGIVTGLYHGREEAIKAQEYFHHVFQKGELPEELPVIKIDGSCRTLFDLTPGLVKQGIVPSASEFRRLVKQGGVQVNQERIEDLDQSVSLDNAVIKIGKKNFIRIIISD